MASIYGIPLITSENPQLRNSVYLPLEVWKLLYHDLNTALSRHRLKYSSRWEGGDSNSGC